MRYAAMSVCNANVHTQNTFYSIPYDLGMVLGFYRPQKDLSWAEKQTFKEDWGKCATQQCVSSRTQNNSIQFPLNWAWF